MFLVFKLRAPLKSASEAACVSHHAVVVDVVGVRVGAGPPPPKDFSPFHMILRLFLSFFFKFFFFFLHQKSFSPSSAAMFFFIKYFIFLLLYLFISAFLDVLGHLEQFSNMGQKKFLLRFFFLVGHFWMFYAVCKFLAPVPKKICAKKTQSFCSSAAIFFHHFVGLARAASTLISALVCAMY